ncbi:MAG: OmcA/MtrC family decaheme c-type cytochrome [Candidatus Hydrogenedentota bacterium]
MEVCSVSRGILRQRPTVHASLILIVMLGTVLSGCSSGGGDSDDTTTSFSFLSENSNLNVLLQQVRIADDLRPAIKFMLFDDAGNTISLDEITHIEFMMAALERVSVGTPFEYRSYSTVLEDPDGDPASGDEAIQAAYDPAGISGLTQNSEGVFTFKFAKALPGDYDRSATHQLGAEIVRFSVSDQRTYMANLAMPFRPDGQPVAAVRDMVSQEACNSCHTQLTANEGLRTEIQLCILCHSSQSTDAETGNSLHFAELIHKIHRGSMLPSLLIDSEPYQIHGIANALVDYSTVDYPQDIRNCVSCHTDAPQAHFYETAPTMVGCQSCHDRVWYGTFSTKPASFSMHPGGVQENNSQCALCHSPEGNGQAPVALSHLFPVDTPGAPGLALAITGIVTSPGTEGTRVEIAFTARDKDDASIPNLSTIERVSATIAWPVAEYQSTVHEVIASSDGPSEGTLITHGDGSYNFTFAAELPVTEENAFVVSLEGRRSFQHRGVTYKQGATQSEPISFSPEATIPSFRRSIVLDQKCNVCHLELRAHDELRVGVDNCVMCHNPNSSDESSRPFELLPPETINFKEMIHRIHTGTDLAHSYSIFDALGAEHDYTSTRFSGDRRDCLMCHVEESMTLPLPPEALSTVITENGGTTVVSESFPMGSACTSCHSTDTSIQHALLYTDNATGAESCATCHGESSELSVTAVHQFDLFDGN